MERFGWEAAHKAPVGEMRRMIAAGNVYDAYRSRDNYRDADGAKNWAEWAAANKSMDRLLAAAMLAAEELEDGG